MRLFVLLMGVVVLLTVAVGVILIGAGAATVAGRSLAAGRASLRRGLLALGTAGLGGIGAGVLASGLTSLDGTLIAILTAMSLFAVMLARAPHRRPASDVVVDGRVPLTSRRRRRRARTLMPADPLARAWAEAGERADWATSRIAVAEASCRRLLDVADDQPLDQSAAEWAGVIRRRVPELVRSCLAECERATPAERETHLHHLVEALEKIGAEADRRRSHHRERAATPFGVQRTYVDQRTANDPLSPD